MPAGIAQQITLLSAEPPLRVTGLRGDSAPTLTGGFGGWTTVPRPRKKALVEWDGIQPLSLALPMLFDGHADDESVELPLARLEQLAGAVRPHGEPPILRVIGAAPHAASVDWVIGLPGGGEPLEWTEPVFWSQDGYRTRQGVTVHLLEYVADDRIETMPAAERARLRALEDAARSARDAGVGGAPPAHEKFYTVKEGDTLSSIAAGKLGDYRRWPEIAEINKNRRGRKLRDPRDIYVGQELRLP